MDKEKFGKIIQLAKYGVGGEKENAINIIKNICVANNLDYDEVMRADETVSERAFYYKNRAEEDVMSQVLWRYAVTDENPDIRYNGYRKVFFVNMTKSKFIEVSYILNIFMDAFRKEKKIIESKIAEAFVIRHKLFSSRNPDYTETGEGTDRGSTSAKDLKAISHIMNVFDDIELRKAISSGKSSIKE